MPSATVIDLPDLHFELTINQSIVMQVRNAILN
jgi:hypothetical protein